MSESESQQPSMPAQVPNAPKQGRGGAGTAVGIGTAAAAALAKGKGGLALFKVLPFGKLLLTSGSMFLSVVAYAASSGLPFAVGFVLMILIHELGHGVAMRRAGIEAGWPVFIPFFGAMIAMKGKPEHPRVEADVAFAGPVAGTAAALVCAGLALTLHSRLLMALAYTGFFLNLFNLLPFGFLDGGRVARVISRKAWIIGALLLGALFLKAPSPQLFMIAVLGGMHALRSSSSPDLDMVTAEDKRTWSVRYFGLCAFLGACIFFSHALIKDF